MAIAHTYVIHGEIDSWTGISEKELYSVVWQEAVVPYLFHRDCQSQLHLADRI